MKAKIIPIELKNEFERVFQTNYRRFFDALFGFDIVKFDEYLQRKHQIQYENDKTSLTDFIEEKYGFDGVHVIEKLLKY